MKIKKEVGSFLSFEIALLRGELKQVKIGRS